MRVPPPSRIAPATLLVACTGAWLLPGARLGLGLTLVAVAIAAAIVWATPGPRTPVEIVYGATAVALVGTAVLRSAPWVIAVDLLAAASLAAMAVAGARSWAESFAAPFAVLRRFIQVPGAITSPVARLVRGRDLSRVGPVFRGTAVASVLLVIFGGLFASADAAFARIAGDVFVPQWDISLLPYRITVFVCAALVCGALILARTAAPASVTGTDVTTSDALWSSPRRRAAVVEWAIPVLVLDLLFAFFVAVQVAVLFGGQRHVLVTEGLTYAEYARQGFFQLLAVATLVLGIIAIVVRMGQPSNRSERVAMQALLGLLCGLTLVVLASALLRLQLYEDTYGLTRLRVSVHATIYWLAGVFALVMVAGAVWKATLLPRALIAFTTAGLVAFTLVNPDALIAQHNVNRFAESGQIDLGYLSTLSADAVPALAELPPASRDCVLSLLALRRDSASPDPWNGYNVGRARAREVLSDLNLPLSTEESESRCLTAEYLN